MRPKGTYTKEEYDALKRKNISLAAENSHLKRELEIARSYLKYVHEHRNGKIIPEIQRIMEEENKKLELKKLFVKYPYYKELKDYVDSGVTDIKTLIQLTSKSKSTVYRALHRMDLLPLEKIDVSKGKLNL